MNKQILSSSAQTPLYPTIYEMGKSTQATHKCLKYKRPQSEMAIPALLSIVYQCSVSYLSGILFLYCSCNPINHQVLSIHLFNSLNEIISHDQHSHHPSSSDPEYYSQQPHDRPASTVVPSNFSTPFKHNGLFKWEPDSITILMKIDQLLPLLLW